MIFRHDCSYPLTSVVIILYHLSYAGSGLRCRFAKMGVATSLTHRQRACTSGRHQILFTPNSTPLCPCKPSANCLFPPPPPPPLELVLLPHLLSELRRSLQSLYTVLKHTIKLQEKAALIKQKWADLDPHITLVWDHKLCVISSITMYNMWSLLWHIVYKNCNLTLANNGTHNICPIVWLVSWFYTLSFIMVDIYLS